MIRLILFSRKELSKSIHKPEPKLETEPEYYEEKFTSIDRNNQREYWVICMVGYQLKINKK